MIDEVSNDQIVALMVGRDVHDLFPTVMHHIGSPILSVKGLSGEVTPHSVNFELRAGEILGIFGLIGSGRTETLRILMGLARGRADADPRRTRDGRQRRE